MINSAYQNYAQMMNALSYIGVNQVRDTYDNPYTTAEFAQMARQLNLKFDFFIALGSVSPEWQMAQIRTNSSIVSYVEGYNESDSWWQNFHGATGIDATKAVQQYIYASVKSDPLLTGVGVIQTTFKSPTSFPAYGDMSAYTDYASTHTYAGTANNPIGSAPGMITQAQTVSPNRPTITTEAGYHTTLNNVHGVSELVQAKYELDLLFEQAKAGVKLTYLWGLVDNYADPDNTDSENHFGLFHNDWTPKLAAIALHNTMQIMADPGTGGVTPGNLNYSLGSLPQSVQSSLYQKSDGTFVLVVWNDVRLSGPTVQQDIVVAPLATTLQLGQQFSHVSIYDPLTGTSSVQQFSDVSSIALQVVDHPLIIELSQNPAYQPVRSIIAAPNQVITNPLSPVQVSGLSVASAADALITVKIESTGNGLSMLDTAGHLLASKTNSIILTGTAAVINAELATLNYTGGSTLGSDAITVTATSTSGLLATRTIPVAVMEGTTATYSGGLAVSVPAKFTSLTGQSLTLPRVSVFGTYAATHGGTVSVTIDTTAGILQVPGSGAAITGNASASVLIVGTLAQVTAALDGLNYTASGQAGQAVITLRAVDQTGFAATGKTTVTVAAPSLTTLPTTTVPTVVVSTPTSTVISTPTTPATSIPTVTTPAPTVVATTPAPVTTPVVVPTPPIDTTPPTLTATQNLSGTTTSTSNVLSGTISDAGSGVAAVEIFMYTGGVVSDIGAATVNGNSWSRTVTGLNPGTYNFFAVGFDRSGNSTAPMSTGPAETVVSSQPVQVSQPVQTVQAVPTTQPVQVSQPTQTVPPARDTTAPTLTIKQSVSGTTTSTSNTLSGTITDSESGAAVVEVFIYSAGSTTDLGPATINGGTWSRTISNLSPGTYSFFAVGYDKAGNSTATMSAGPSSTVVAPPPRDTTAPTLTAKQTVSGTTTKTSNTLSGTVSDSGSGVAVVEIFQYTAGRTTDLGPATLNGGTWSRTINNLSPGTYSFFAVGFDKAGNSTAPLSTGAAETVVRPTAAAAATTESGLYRFFDSKSGAQFLTASLEERDTVMATRPDLIAEGVGLGTVTQPEGDSNAIAIYRFFDTNNGTHFYTSSTAERDDIIANRADLAFEGKSFYEHETMAPGDVAVYRFFNQNNGTHFYTANEAERSTILATRPDLTPEGISFFAPATPNT